MYRETQDKSEPKGDRNYTKREAKKTQSRLNALDANIKSGKAKFPFNIYTVPKNKYGYLEGLKYKNV